MELEIRTAVVYESWQQGSRKNFLVWRMFHILTDILGSGHIHFTKPVELYFWEVELNMCVYISLHTYFTSIKKNWGVGSSGVTTLLGTTLMGNADNGAGGTWELSAPSSQFCCEPKAALKTYKVFLKTKGMNTQRISSPVCSVLIRGQLKHRAQLWTHRVQ